MIKRSQWLLAVMVVIGSSFFSALSADEVLPDGLNWQTNDSDEVFADPNAKKGGTFRSAILSFPLTLRVVGPDSNSGFRSSVLGNQMKLVNFHPQTLNPIPVIATHWAFGDDGKTVYYKLNPDARWSDGLPVTADDFLFTLEFMRSKFIVAPWYNNHYTEEITNVIKYNDNTIAVVGNVVKPEIDLLYYYGIAPTPRHFHKLDENWVKDFNWEIEPNTGPYQISKIKKGKQITFERKKDWWAKDLKYFKNRFNVDKVRVKVIRDINVAYNTFLKGKLDVFGLTLPEYWHDKTNKPEYENGYIDRIWFYNDTPQPSSGIWLNTDFELFKDKNVRYGFAHAMNIQKTIDTVLRGDYLRLQNHYTGYGKYTNTEIKARTFDLGKADQYFDAAGWTERDKSGIRIKDGKRLAVKVTYSNQIQSDRLVVLKEEAKKAGLDLQLQLLDGIASYKNVVEKKHQAAWMGWGSGFRPAFWEHYHSENAHKPQTNNITNTDNSNLDAKIMAYRTANDESERISLSHEIQRMLYEEAVYIPTYSVPYVRNAYWRWMKLPDWYGTKSSEALFGPMPTGDNSIADYGGLTWIDEEIKEETLKAKKKKKPIGEPVIIIDETFKPEP